MPGKKKFKNSRRRVPKESNSLVIKPDISQRAWNMAGSRGSTSVLRRLSWSTTVLTATVLRIFDSGVASATEWSSFSGTYSLYRVRAFRVHYNAGNSADGFVVFGLDPSGTLAAVGSAAAAYALQKPRIYNSVTTGKALPYYQASPAVWNNAQWLNTASPAASYAVQLWNGGGGTANVFVEYLVEFNANK